MTRTKNDAKAERNATTEAAPFDEPEQRRDRPTRAVPKKARDDALARQRARERAARDD